jgi:hypothetical protein
MMKKFLIITILFAIVQISTAQVLPKGFRLTQLQKTFAQIQTDRPNVIRYNIRTSPVESNTIISNFISDIIVKGDTIWYGTGKGIARTFNFGNTFQNYYGTDPFGEYDVSGITVYKSFVVVGTAESRKISETETLPAGTGIKVSSDFGNTWNAYPQPKDPNYGVRFDSIRYGNNWIKSLLVNADEQNLSYDILVTKKNLASDSLTIWITSWAGELRKSTDYGAHFTRVILPPDNLDSIYPGGNYSGSRSFAYDPTVNDNHKGFSVTAENDSTIYVGTAGGINKSTDWGVSWRKYNFENTGHGTGISGNFVVALKVQRFAGMTILWGATNPGGGAGGQFAAISYTTDGGTTWHNTLGGEDESVFSHAVGFKDSLVYAATDNGIWRSYFTPPNFSWAKPSIIYDEEIKDRIHGDFFYAVDSQGDSIWVGSGDGLCRTRDRGNPWTEKWKIFRGYKPVNSTQETYAAPNPFSPDDEVTRIYYKTGTQNVRVTIRIFDFGMNPVKVLLQNATRSTPGMQWTAWDGRRDDGMQVANGVYFYRIEVDNDLTFWGKILVLQ